MALNVVPKESVDDLRERLAYAERAKQLINRIHATRDANQIIAELTDEILSLFDAERLTIYATEHDKKEIYSTFLDRDSLKDITQIRLSIDENSIAGFVAKNCVMVNVTDVYNKEELRRINPAISFDSSWDKKTGFRTRQLLTAPLSGNDTMIGVIQLCNKKRGNRFTKEDEERFLEIAKALGIGLYNQYRLARRKASKFDYLISSGLITQAEMDEAITESREKQRDIESLLVEKYKLSKNDIGKSYSLFYNCPFLEFDERVFIPPELVKHIRPSYLKVNYWIPLRRSEDTIEVLIDDPHAFNKLQDIKRLFPVRHVKLYVGLREDIVKFVNTVIASVDPSAAKQSIAEILGELSVEEKPKAEEAAATIDENDSAIVRLANQVIIDGYRAGASDIHVEPNSDKKETVIRFRVDGICHEYQRIPAYYRKALTSRLKIMARLDIAERRKPQDGKIKFLMPDRDIELRVATIPTAGADNEDVVMRVLAASEPIPLDQMKMSERNLQGFKELLDKPYGLILCVGPTGSGKTTTLHAALGFLNDPQWKIWTAEDPVEITQYGLRQVQVQPKIGFNFAAAMRSFLRADPDIIMIGEMRDRETCEIAIEASLTGHLVFSTLHTNSAVETVTRLLEIGMEPFNFADALLGILAQRLARTICQKCKEKYHPPKEEYDALAHAYGEEAFTKTGIAYNDRFFLYRGKGCEACNNTGYRGRIALHELLVATDEVKQLIQTRATMSKLLEIAVAQGITTLLQDGIMKSIRGWTDFRQVKAVAMR